MSTSDARSAMPSSRMRAPSFTSAYTRRSTISSSDSLRGVMPAAVRASTMIFSTSASGYAVRSPGLYRYQPLPVFWP